MTINQLLYFISIVENKNFLEASENLNISQSSLSKSIQRLEDEMGLKLLDRSRRNATLTEEGKLFYKGAVKTLASHNEMLKSIDDYSKNKKDKIRIATLPIVSQYNLSEKLINFSNKNSSTELIVSEIEDYSILSELDKDNYDFAITRKELIDESKYEYYTIDEDRLVAILPSFHHFSLRSELSLKELKDERFILMNKYVSVYSTCIKACEECGFSPNVIRTARTESIISSVKSGEGISLLMEKNIGVFSSNNLAVIPLEEEIISTVVIVHKKGAKLSVASKSLLNYILDKC